MKTIKTIFILAAFLGFQFNTLFAAGNFNDPPASSNNLSGNTVSVLLAPVTLTEATFEESYELNESLQLLAGLTPAIPVVADFNDVAPVPEVSATTLAPVTPREAVFEDETGNSGIITMKDLAPVTPAVADFEDHV